MPSRFPPCSPTWPPMPEKGPVVVQAASCFTEEQASRLHHGQKAACTTARRPPALRAVLRDWSRDTRSDVALASASSMVPYLRRELRDVPAVVDLVDVDSQKWLDYAAAGRGPRSWLYKTEGLRLRRLERGVVDWAPAVTLAAQAEAELYRRFCATGPLHAVTTGVDLEHFRPAGGAQ